MNFFGFCLIEVNELGELVLSNASRDKLMEMLEILRVIFSPMWVGRWRGHASVIDENKL